MWRDQLGFTPFSEAHFDVEGIYSVFLLLSGQPGEMSIELVEPVDKTDMTNPVARCLAKGAVYLFCLPESNSISGEIVLAAGGLRM